MSSQPGGARDESGDRAIVEVLEYSWEEEVPEVVRSVICYNHPFSPNRAYKEIAEFRKWSLDSRVEEVLAEEPLEGRRGRSSG
jgi:hypothetical protein